MYVVYNLVLLKLVQNFQQIERFSTWKKKFTAWKRTFLWSRFFYYLSSVSYEKCMLYAISIYWSFGNSTMRLFCNFFFANHWYYLNLISKKLERMQGNTLRRVHWDTQSHRAPHISNINKSLDVYPAGFYLKFLYNYNCHHFCASMMSFYASFCYTVIVILKFTLILGFLIVYFDTRHQNGVSHEQWANWPVWPHVSNHKRKTSEKSEKEKKKNQATENRVKSKIQIWKTKAIHMRNQIYMFYVYYLFKPVEF